MAETGKGGETFRGRITVEFTGRRGDRLHGVVFSLPRPPDSWDVQGPALVAFADFSSQTDREKVPDPAEMLVAQLLEWLAHDRCERPD